MIISQITKETLMGAKINAQLHVLACLSLESFQLIKTNPSFEFKDYHSSLLVDSLYSSKTLANFLTVVKKFINFMAHLLMDMALVNSPYLNLQLI